MQDIISRWRIQDSLEYIVLVELVEVPEQADVLLHFNAVSDHVHILLAVDTSSLADRSNWAKVVYGHVGLGRLYGSETTAIKQKRYFLGYGHRDYNFEMLSSLDSTKNSE